MPNGGPDNCAHCAYNPNGAVCFLRDIIVTNKAYTYCANHSHAQREGEKPIGPVYAQGVEGYSRIPWLDHREPYSRVKVKCFDCGDFVDTGIEITLKTGEKFGFCSDRNYVAWWNDRSKGLSSDHLDPQNYSPCPKEEGRMVNSFIAKIKQ